MKKIRQGFIIKKIKMKKGVSEIISWVLLIGFAVSLAAIVTMWTLRNTETTTEGVVKMVRGDIKCSEVFINLAIDCTTKTLTVINNGKFKIDKLMIRADGTIETIESNLMPGKEESLNIDFINNIEVIPLVKLDKEFIGCSDKAKEVEC